jgi:hypothetical protein
MESLKKQMTPQQYDAVHMVQSFSNKKKGKGGGQAEV